MLTKREPCDQSHLPVAGVYISMVISLVWAKALKEQRTKKREKSKMRIVVFML
jgi:hypothetical protein